VGLMLWLEEFPFMQEVFQMNFILLILLIKVKKRHSKKELTPILFVYIAGWIIAFVGGMIFQYKTRGEEAKKKELDENADYFLKK